MVGYARQEASITPDIIDAIAADFRLGVQTPQTQSNKTASELDLQKAARSLLELYAHLQSEKTIAEEELAARELPRVTKQ